MGKISYASLKLKTKEDIKTVDFNGNLIEIKQYLPLEDKLSLINIIIQNASEGGICNPLKVNAFYHLYLVYLYTNINFTEAQKRDELKLYDTLESNGLIDLIIENMNEHEYSTLLNFINEKIEIDMKFNTTVAGIINNIIENLPGNAEKATALLNNFDQSQFQDVINFAKSIGMSSVSE